MAQKLNIKTLAKKYNNFFKPNAEVYASNQEIQVTKNLRLERVEVVSGVGVEPDMAVMVYRADRIGNTGVNELEKHLNAGEKVEVKAGYGDTLTRIFLGYLHEIKVHCSQEKTVEYTLVCLDVKGLMRKNSSFQISGKKKAQQMLDDILNEATYSFLIEKKNKDDLPADFNQDCIIRGDTHYDWLCSLAEYVDYEFYCCRGELFFRKAQKDTTVMLELSREYGLRSVSTVVSVEGQLGSVQVNGYNRNDAKITGSERRAGVSGPFLQKLNKTLQGCGRVIRDMELETGKQAALRAKAIMNRSLRKCSRMEAENIGIPDLLPGVCVSIDEGNVKSLSGTIYVEEVEHILDERGYRTVVRGAIHDF